MEFKVGRPKVVTKIFTGIVERVVQTDDGFTLYTYNYDYNPAKIISIEHLKHNPLEKNTSKLKG